MASSHPATAALGDYADEAALVGALRRNEPHAYEVMVRAYGPRMLATARRISGSDADAQDALQDAFLSAFKAIGTFEGGSRLGTWLHRIVANAALARLRKQRRRGERSIEALLPAFEQNGHLTRPANSWPIDGEVDLMKRELQHRIRQRIMELPDDYRDVLMLRDIEELDTASTATVLGISEGAVKTRLHRARLALRTLLEAEFLA